MPNPDLMPPAVWADLWDRLTQGRDRADHPFRTATLATADALGRPDARTVVLRQLDPAARRLDFQTDRRAPKFSTLQRNAAVAWLFWDAKDQLQLRMHAAATLHTGDDVAEQQWNAIPPAGRTAYRVPLATGTTLDGPDAPSPGDTDGRHNFAVVRCAVASIDWLKMLDGHWKRLYFEWPNGDLQSRWLMP